MTIDEILNIDQFKYLIGHTEATFFANKNKDAIDLRIIFETDFRAYMYEGKIDLPEGHCFNVDDADAYMTAIQGNMMKNIISSNTQKINSSLLILYLGAMSQKYLNWILDAEHGKHKGIDEFCYTDGEIISVDQNNVLTNKPDTSLQDIKTRLAEGILIAASQLSNSKKELSRIGTYYGRGINGRITKENINSDNLKKFAKSKEVISNLDKNKFVEYIKSGIVKKWDVFKFIDRDMIPADVAIDLMLDGVFTPSEIYSKVLHIKNESDIARCDKIGFTSKLLLYSSGKMKIADLEKSSKFEEKRNELTLSKDDIAKISKYYKGNINKISELLTHNVLDFTLSMTFLDGLVREGCITEEDKNYLVNIMNDFKTSELLNGTENHKFASSGNGTVRPKFHTNGVTIDPNLRKNYFASIGDVKEIFINGERLISDESKGITEKNSLDGYQLIIIPDKKIAVLEKFYEVTRNKEGKLEYKKDKNGNYIAATENATFIMPIAMAKDFVETKNKQELIKSPYVARTLHTMNWVKNSEDSMKKVARRTGLDIEFNRENTDKWAQKVTENYKKLRAKRMNTIDDLI